MSSNCFEMPDNPSYITVDENWCLKNWHCSDSCRPLFDAQGLKENTHISQALVPAVAAFFKIIKNPVSFHSRRFCKGSQSWLFSISSLNSDHLTLFLITIRQDSPALKDEVSLMRQTINEQQHRLLQEIGERGELHHRYYSLGEQEQAILSSIPALIYIKDQRNRIVRANNHFLTAFHLSPDMLPLGVQKQQELLPFAILCAEDAKLLKTNQPVTLEERCLPIEPSKPAWFWISKIPFRAIDDSPSGLVCTLLDITAGKLAEISIKESEELFRTLAEHSFSAVFIFQSGELKYVNPILRHTLNIPSSTPNSAINLFQLFVKADATRLQDKIQAILHEGLNYSRFQLEGQSSSGNPLFLESFLTQIEFKGSTAVLGSLLDITDKHLAARSIEEKATELQTINMELERRIQAELEKRRQDQELFLHQSKMAAMGEMIGAIAHHWRQPLTTLSIFIQNLENAFTFGKIEESFIERFVTDSLVLVNRMTESIDQFRNFFSIENSEIAVNLHTLLSESVLIFSKTFSETSIGVDIAAKVRDINWISHPNALKQVLITLLRICTTLDISPTPGHQAIHLAAATNRREVHIKISFLRPPPSSLQSSKAIDDILHTHVLAINMSKKLIQDHMQGSLTFEKSQRNGIEFHIQLPLK